MAPTEKGSEGRGRDAETITLELSKLEETLDRCRVHR